MGLIIIIGIVALVVMGMQNAVADWGQKRREEQMRIGRGTQSFFIILVVIAALIFWAALSAPD